MGVARRVHLGPLPGHVLDLNPAEGLWNHLKRVELANLCAHGLGS